MDKEIKKRFRDLERRIEMLEKKKPGLRLQEIADWLIDLFEDVDQIKVRTIMAKGKKLGYSSQMIQRARRELLEDEIGYSVMKGEGWSWFKLEK